MLLFYFKKILIEKKMERKNKIGLLFFVNNIKTLSTSYPVIGKYRIISGYSKKLSA